MDGFAPAPCLQCQILAPPLFPRIRGIAVGSLPGSFVLFPPAEHGGLGKDPLGLAANRTPTPLTRSHSSLSPEILSSVKLPAQPRTFAATPTKKNRRGQGSQSNIAFSCLLKKRSFQKTCLNQRLVASSERKAAAMEALVEISSRIAAETERKAAAAEENVEVMKKAIYTTIKWCNSNSQCCQFYNQIINAARSCQSTLPSGEFKKCFSCSRTTNAASVDLPQRRGRAEECKRKWSSIRDQLRRTLQKRKTKSGQAAHKNRKYKYEDILTFLVPHLGEREGISNVTKLQDDEEDDENESVDDKGEDFAKEKTCQQRTGQQRTMDEESITEDENIPGATRDNNFPSSHVFGNKYMFVKPKALKRKILLPTETLQDSPSRQLMAFILAEKEAEKKATYLQDPVNALLGGIAPSLKFLNPHLLNEAKGRIFGVVQEMELRQFQMNANGQGPLTDLMACSSPSSPAPDASPDYD
ncbi:hypothetical protein J437_LFUL005345 [Ladona fulva]|uniref:MADF domain-containing protein n=1 Tax=Ladona fulva TaxID=123851 RepID=A0A8K0JZ42_LADFU|nr:hypothetical protein J437_LFUL005345 [Ladona fulva]